MKQEIKNKKKSWKTSLFGSLAGKDRDDGSGNDDSNKEKLFELRPIHKPVRAININSFEFFLIYESYERLNCLNESMVAHGSFR